MLAITRWNVVALVVVLALGAAPLAGDGGPGRYRSPWAIAVSPTDGTAYIADSTAGCVEIYDSKSRSVRGQIALAGQPRGLCLSADGRTLFVAERGAGTVAVVDTRGEAVTSRIEVGRRPIAVALAPKSNRLFVCNQDEHSVSVIDLAQSPPKLIAEVAVVREPSSAAVTADERYVVVANQTPYGRSTDPTLAADVSIIDALRLETTATVKLPPGSTVANGVCTSPDGRWAYVVHGLGHFNLPMTQLERGWVNTYALTIIGIQQGRRLATLLLDDVMQGAADPSGVVCSTDGRRLYVSHTGVHEVSIVEIDRLHELLVGHVPDELARLMDGSLPNIWVRIQRDPKLIDELTYDLTALYLSGASRRVPSGAKGPRGMALSSDSRTLLVVNYFSGSVAELDAVTGQLLSCVSLGPQPEADTVRRGELLFHDATVAFQRWHSCATCHPNDGREDGLRWDFADDGLGNGMNTPSVLYPDKTEPLHRQGGLATTRILAEHGLTFTHLTVPTNEQVSDLVAYMTSLRADASPHLEEDGTLTAAAQRGKSIFAGKAECAACHQGPYFTDQKLYNVGVVSPNFADAKFKTTPLVELYRSAPYLHDGRALTLREVLTTCNPRDEHGKTKTLNDQEIDDLVAYLRSL